MNDISKLFLLSNNICEISLSNRVSEDAKRKMKENEKQIPQFEVSFLSGPPKYSKDSYQAASKEKYRSLNSYGQQLLATLYLIDYICIIAKRTNQ